MLSNFASSFRASGSEKRLQSVVSIRPFIPFFLSSKSVSLSSWVPPLVMKATLMSKDSHPRSSSRISHITFWMFPAENWPELIRNLERYFSEESCFLQMNEVWRLSCKFSFDPWLFYYIQFFFEYTRNVSHLSKKELIPWNELRTNTHKWATQNFESR